MSELLKHYFKLAQVVRMNEHRGSKPDADIIIELQGLATQIQTALKLQELVKKTEHDLVTSDDMTTFHENWKDHEVSQLLADMIKESERITSGGECKD